MRPNSRTDSSVSVGDRLERLTISDSVVFERFWGTRGRVVLLLVGIVLEDMVPGCLLFLAVPSDRALKGLCDPKQVAIC